MEVNQRKKRNDTELQTIFLEKKGSHRAKTIRKNVVKRMVSLECGKSLQKYEKFGRFQSSDDSESNVGRRMVRPPVTWRDLLRESVELTALYDKYVMNRQN